MHIRHKLEVFKDLAYLLWTHASNWNFIRMNSFDDHCGHASFYYFLVIIHTFVLTMSVLLCSPQAEYIRFINTYVTSWNMQSNNWLNYVELSILGPIAPISVKSGNCYYGNVKSILNVGLYNFCLRTILVFCI